MAKNVDHTGWKSEDVELLRRIPSPDKIHGSHLARCRCGVEWVVQTSNVVQGHTRSCGCRSGEMNWARRPRKLLPGDRDAIVQLRLAGRTSADIARVFGVHASRVRQVWT